jgi:hypothetical protein
VLHEATRHGISQDAPRDLPPANDTTVTSSDVTHDGFTHADIGTTTQSEDKSMPVDPFTSFGSPQSHISLDSLYNTEIDSVFDYLQTIPAATDDPFAFLLPETFSYLYPATTESV